MRKLKITILSLSVITVMAGAATAPALGAIASHFADVNPLTIKMVLTIPPLFIILTTLVFGKLSNVLSVRKIAVIGLVLYILGGCGAGLVDNVYLLLLLRAILGVGVGMIMPLSTGLISYYFDRSEQSKLMGYSSAMNNLGGVIAMSLAGFLVTFNWRYSFAVYLLGFAVLALIMAFLPDTRIKGPQSKVKFDTIKKVYPYMIGIFLTMLIFYTLPTNFSIVVLKEKLFAPSLIGAVLSVQTLGAFIMGLRTDFVKKLFGFRTKYVSVLVFFAGYLILSFAGNIVLLSAGLMAVGLGLGLLVPLMNSQIGFRVDREEVTSVMAIMSSMLYLGQFLSPIAVRLSENFLKTGGIRFPYYFSAALSLVLLIGMKKMEIE